jgi:integrase
MGTIEDYPTQADARRAAEGLRLEINNGLPLREAVTFQGLIDRYISEEIENGDLAHTTREPDLNRIHKHISPRWGICLLREIKPYPVQDWLRKLPLAPKTKGHIRGLMYRLLEKAMLWELIPLERNPMGLVELKGVSKRLKPPRILTEEEFGALLDQLDHPYRCMVLLAGCTGLRISEVLGLRWNLIDFESLVMEVREGYARSEVTKLKSEFPGRIAAGSRCRNRSAGMEASMPRDGRRLGFPQPTNAQTLRFRHAEEESASRRSVTSQDRRADRLAYFSSLLSSLARRNGCSPRRATKADASCQHLNHDERLWRSLHGSEAQSQYIRRAARIGPRSLQITKAVWRRSLSARTLLDHFGPQLKIRIPRNLMMALVAGGGFEPPTFGL